MSRFLLFVLAAGCRGGKVELNETGIPEDTDTDTDADADADSDADSDADTDADADSVAAGDVIISEFLAIPDPNDGPDGEWIEVYNTTESELDLSGWTVSAGAGGSFTIDDSVMVAAGGYAVFTASSSTATTGVASPDYVYSATDLRIDDTSGELGLSVGGREIFSLDYDTTWPKYWGYATSLDPDHLDASDGTQVAYWCYPSSRLSNGTFGTPGTANDLCTTVDHDGDGISVSGGDCDDTDASVSPEVEDAANGADDNCNGVVDEDAVVDLAGGFLQGTNSLAYAHGLSVGDVDGDGRDELLVGQSYAGTYYAGAVYVMALEEAADWDGAIVDYDDAVLEGEGSYHELGSLDCVLADNDGDGVDDLLVGAYNYSDSYCSGCPQAVLMSGGSHISGRLSSVDAQVSFGGASGSVNLVMGHADLEGDGVADVVLADTNADGSYTGAVYVFDTSSLSGAVALDDADATLRGGAAYAYVGSTLGAGDVDGDGHDDLLVGSSGFYSTTGAVYLMYGGAGGIGDRILGDTADVEFVGLGYYQYMGWSENLPIDDIDGDGRDDVVLSAPGAGQVHVWLDGDFAGVSYDTTDSDLSISVSGISSYFGYAMATGDIDDDGATDLLVGAPDYPSAYYARSYTDDQGLALAFDSSVFGGDASLDDAAWVMSGSSVGDLVGLSLLLHDADGDGHDDAIIAAPGAADGAGRVYVVPSE